MILNPAVQVVVEGGLLAPNMIMLLIGPGNSLRLKDLKVR